MRKGTYLFDPFAIIFRLIAPDIHILHPIVMQFMQKSLGLLKMVTKPL